MTIFFAQILTQNETFGGLLAFVLVVWVILFHILAYWLGGFSIDGGDKWCVPENRIEKLREGVLKVLERTFSQNAGQGDGMRRLFTFFSGSEWKKFLKLVQREF